MQKISRCWHDWVTEADSSDIAKLRKGKEIGVLLTFYNELA